MRNLISLTSAVDRAARPRPTLFLLSQTGVYDCLTEKSAVALRITRASQNVGHVADPSPAEKGKKRALGATRPSLTMHRDTHVRRVKGTACILGERHLIYIQNRSGPAGRPECSGNIYGCRNIKRIVPFGTGRR
ncbi:hypothetical protein EVAR_2864_1 [Eumeta japonica]|uniref:Uncharacterized protein n=1 Tax=Eumeta variegata TaxID=151549 RepID=A0A4C1T0S0_EUMVA|nr:hypothetical protein EVAR_2864_1 [Eumeta japonica]